YNPRMSFRKEAAERRVVRELRFPPDGYVTYDPDGNCCEIVIATAYNTLTGRSIAVADLVRMGYRSNRFGGGQMAQQLNWSETGPRRFYMKPFEIRASKRKVEETFRRHLSQGELIYLVVYINEWWEHVLEGHGDVGNSGHAVLIHEFEQEGKKTIFHIYDPLQWKDQGKIKVDLDQLWPTLFLMQGLEGEIDRLIGLEQVKFAVFTY
ncbi:MAG: hypothetical protein WAV56_00405, partial [Microgenomates group bacterium]